MYLADIVDAKKIRIPQKKEILTPSVIKEIEKNCEKKIRQEGEFYRAIQKKGISIIAEIKMASPSKGIIRENINIPEIVDQYNKFADAISVLTEEDYFLGSPSRLKETVKYSRIPVLMKDFVIDPVQIYEASYLGAKAVLLIANILKKEQLMEFYSIANDLGLDSLVEVHNEYDLEKAMYVEPEIIGVNNRNLETFEIDLNTTKNLRNLIPKDILLVSESGIKNIEDVSFLKNLSVDGVLVGEAFMKAESLSETLRSFKDA